MSQENQSYISLENKDNFTQGDRINIGTSRFKARLITDDQGHEVLPINEIMRRAGLQAIKDIIHKLPKDGIDEFYHVFLDFDGTKDGVIAPQDILKTNRALISLSNDYYDLHIENDVIKLKLGQLYSDMPHVPEFVTPDTHIKTPCKLNNGMYCAYIDYAIPLGALNAIAIPDYVTGDKSENGFYFGVQFTGQGRF